MITIESARGDFLYYELHALEKIYTPVFFMLPILDIPGLYFTIPSHIVLQLHGKYGKSYDHDVIRFMKLQLYPVILPFFCPDIPYLQLMWLSHKKVR